MLISKLATISVSGVSRAGIKGRVVDEKNNRNEKKKKTKMFRKLFLNLVFCSVVFCLPLENFFDDPIDNEITKEEKGTDLSYLGELVFGRPRNTTGEKLATWNVESEVNPEEVGEYVEGDILFLNDKRNGLVAEAAHWEDGEIPYEIEGIFVPADLAMIEKAMGEYHRLTCIKYARNI